MTDPILIAVLDRSEAFISRAEIRGYNDCWLWQGRKTPRGYGHFSLRVGGRRREVYAHRAMWMLDSSQSIPDNLTLDHLCRTPACVNPAHLEAVPQKVNNHRAIPSELYRTPERHESLRGDVSWKARFREYHDGRKIDRSCSFASKAAAEEFLAALNGNILRRGA